jgi:hypothetical protein
MTCSPSWNRSPSSCLTGICPWPKSGCRTSTSPGASAATSTPSPGPPTSPRLTGVAQAAFEVNLLTEDNLPSYHHQLLASFGRDWAWRTWSHRWTAEEGRHAGVGIQGFTRKALQMAQAGIYDLRIHHDEILWPLLRHWDLFGLEGLDPQAEQARDRLATHLAKTDRLANRFEAKRAATAANEHSAAG